MNVIIALSSQPDLDAANDANDHKREEVSCRWKLLTNRSGGSAAEECTVL